jgi:signal peptidase I
MKQYDKISGDREFINESVGNMTRAEKKKADNGTYKEIKEWAQAILTAVVLALLIRTFLFEIILVDGESMLPTLHHGDRVFVSKIGYIIGEPEHGDIVIFRNPNNPRDNFVKRVIGLPGDTVSIIDGVVYRNGEPLTEDYIDEPSIDDYPETVVPPDTIFALGDNRNRSLDSTDPVIGFIPISNLMGKAKLRVWPLDDMTYFE